MLNRIPAYFSPMILAAIWAMALSAIPAGAQPYRGEDPAALVDRATVTYEIDLARTASQLITVRMTLPDINAEVARNLSFSISSSSASIK